MTIPPNNHPIHFRPKKEIRKEYQIVLKNLDRRWLMAASQRLCRNLTNLFNQPTHQSVKHILCFSSFFPGEIDLSPFISQLQDEKKIYLPRSSPDGTMKFISIGQDWSHAPAGLFGIQEPESGALFTCEEPTKSAIIMPGLAFDTFGNRLGRGKGYYDRFMGQRANRHILTIGVCWDLQILDHVPTESHDMTLQWLVSEEQTLYTGFKMDRE